MGAAAAAGAAGGVAGSLLSAYFSAKEAKRQRDFQERMYKSRYQNTMSDMKLAGLNPILAYQTGVGGVSPQGAMGQVPDFGGSSARAAEAGLKAYKGKAEKSLLTEQRRVAHTQAEANVASAYKAYKEGDKAHSGSLLNQQMYWERNPVTEYYRRNPNAALFKEGLNVIGSSARSAAQLFRRPGTRYGPRLPSNSVRRQPGKLESDWMRRNP